MGNTDAAKVIAFGSLVGLTTVIMVLLMGLSRVVLAMSRDGLLPRSLSKTSTIRATPVRLQIICGAAVALVAGLTNVDLLEEMINIGTLSAFVMVSLGILVLRKKRPDLKPAFRVPFGKVLPIVSAVLCLYLMTNLAVETWIFFAIWLVIGIAIYFAYGQRHSRLNEKFAEAKAAVNGAPAAAGGDWDATTRTRYTRGLTRSAPSASGRPGPSDGRPSRLPRAAAVMGRRGGPPTRPAAAAVPSAAAISRRPPAVREPFGLAQLDAGGERLVLEQLRPGMVLVEAPRHGLSFSPSTAKPAAASRRRSSAALAAPGASTDSGNGPAGPECGCGSRRPPAGRRR